MCGKEAESAWKTKAKSIIRKPAQTHQGAYFFDVIPEDGRQSRMNICVGESDYVPNTDDDIH